MADRRRIICGVCTLGVLLASTLAVAGPDKQALDLLPKTEWRTVLRKTGRFGRGLLQMSRPVMADDTLYIGSAQGGLFALQRSGKPRWVFPTNGPVYGAPALTQHRVYVGDAKGFVYAVRRTDGSEEWRSEIGDEIIAQPLVKGKQLYVVTMRGELVCIDRATGVVRWRTPERLVVTEFTVRGASDPVLVHGLILVGYADGQLAAHRPENGTIAWERRVAPRRQHLHDVDTTPLVAGDLVLAASAGGGLTAVRAATGDVAWQVADIGSPNALFADGDRLYVAGRGAVYALTLSTGALQWKQAVPESETSAPIVAKGRVHVVAPSGRLYMLDAATGTIIATKHVGAGVYAQPVLHDGRIYLLTTASRLVALRVP